MTKYIVKLTITEGDHAGKIHYLDKRGYVRNNLDYIWQEDSYTLAGCKAACTRAEKKNTAEVIFERRERARRIAEGKPVSRYPLYEMTAYEPFAIETVDA